MGDEVGSLSFDAADFDRFDAALARETALLRTMLESGGFSEAGFVAGFELEAWLIDRSGFPAPINDAFLERLADPLVVPELSRFNVELNGTPQTLGGGALRRLEAELEGTWRRCLAVSHDLESSLAMIGILPTVREEQFSLANMSTRRRYAALNERVLAARDGRPLRVRIEGEEALDTVHGDVMLEAATTSFQIHLQVPASRAARFHNASVMLSAPLVAAGANSPLLFGRLLWHETRIPLFEQACEPLLAPAAPGHEPRVSLGTGYCLGSIADLFETNCRAHPVLLPVTCDEPPERFAHLRLHNGTVWRWNRPIVGFDADGTPHLRVEHRVLPAGPSIRDQIANMAMYLGAVTELARPQGAPEAGLPFESAVANFRAAAREGLAAELEWAGRRVPARTLLLEELLPMAERGLERLGLPADEVSDYLDVVRARVRLGQTGAVWQRTHFLEHGRDVLELTAAYLSCQRSGMPVHEWPS